MGHSRRLGSGVLSSPGPFGAGPRERVGMGWLIVGLVPPPMDAIIWVVFELHIMLSESMTITFLCIRIKLIVIESRGSS